MTLSEAQSAEIREVLEERRDQILSRAHEARAFSRDRDRTRMGRDSIDDSAEEAMFGTKLRLADRENHILNQIAQSLKRLASGALGECEECEDDIAFGRLKANPAATLCVACQEDRESG